jgi:hypothetical protein
MEDNKSVCKIYVNVPYNKKDTAKGLWFRYDGDRKEWYIQVRNVKDVRYLKSVCFLFNLIDVEGVNMEFDEVDKIKREFEEIALRMMEESKWVTMKKRLYYVKVKNVCEECFKVDFMELVDGKCEECFKVDIMELVDGKCEACA